MIHPQLTTDPYNKRGYIGTVISINEFDEVTIEFEDSTVGLYDINALILQSNEN